MNNSGYYMNIKITTDFTIKAIENVELIWCILIWITKCIFFTSNDHQTQCFWG